MNWLEYQINKNPDKLFIKEGFRSYSYLNIHDMVKVYSRSLTSLGVKSKDKIVICLPSGIEMVEVILACFDIGLIAVPISIHLSQDECQSIIDKIKPRILR